MQQQHYHQADDSEDRRNRFLSSPNQAENNGSGTLRERAASQPPRSSDQAYLSSPSQQHIIPSSLGGGGGTSPWSNARLLSPTRGGAPQNPIPIRSSSFSTHPQAQFSSAMRESRAFASTFEDDESESLSDTYDERYIPPSMSNIGRGRTYAQDLTRSRSQSLATSRPGPIGSPYLGSPPGISSWTHETSSALNIPGGRYGYGDLKPPGTSRYGSLGTMGRSPTNIHSSSPIVSNGNGYSRQTVDISNMSPFVRDVGQILLDDGSAFRELWAGMNPPRDENGGGGSGTTSRRHSVSVVQPRRGNIVGFNAPGTDGPEETSRPAVFQQGAFGRGGLMLTDDDLASDLNMLSLNPNDRNGPTSPQHPPSQPSSLPIYAPLSRSPASNDLVSPYQSINNLSSSFSSRQGRGSPSDSGLSGNGVSPPRTQAQYEQQLADQYFSPQQVHQQQQQQQPALTARFIPGHGIQYMPPQMNNNDNGGGYNQNRYAGGLPSPVSPTNNRNIHPQQQPFYPQQMQRRPSDANAPAASLTELGKGVPLHAVPPSWPLFIVEFKAGRTDLFYLTDLSQDIRVGDLVIVEADRGKDLGKVVNDSITLAEVEAFQKAQMDRAGDQGDQGGPISPGGTTAPVKKEINPKMIYGKAQQQDTQYVFNFSGKVYVY